MIQHLRDLPLRNATVFLRAGFDVPLDEQGNITEDGRIRASLPTIAYCRAHGASLVIGFHVGRPKGKPHNRLRTRVVAERLQQLLGVPVRYVPDAVGTVVDEAKATMQPGDVLVLENLRFYAGEEENDVHFAKQLSHGIDVYINDAFSALHRAHASVVALPRLLPACGIGLLVEKEIQALTTVRDHPEQPFVALISGAKISDKIEVIRSLALHAEAVLLGGGVANAFLKGIGFDVQASLVESSTVAKDQEGVDYARVAHEIVSAFAGQIAHLPLLMPVAKIQPPLDVIVAESTDEDAAMQIIDVRTQRIPFGWMILDIGPQTRQLFADVIQCARTVFWNGPMGLFEKKQFAEGSFAVARAIAQSDAYSVLGGGDTEAVIHELGFEKNFDHVSTGGGASLAFLARAQLPGLTILE